jgi:hypothetical protein
MKTTRLFLLLAAALLMAAPAAHAQTFEAEIGTDLVSHYIWRGQELGQVSIQPTLGISAWGLSLSAWGSVGLSNPTDTKELDLTLAYSIGGFNIGVTDYWFNSGPDPDAHYFRYKSGLTNHVFEANVGYDFGPVAIQWFTNFAGNDPVAATGKCAYSSYAELSVPFSLGGLEWSAAAGVVPFATDFYGVGRTALVNVSLTATKDIVFSERFSLPVFATLAANPHDRRLFFVAGITLRP